MLKIFIPKLLKKFTGIIAIMSFISILCLMVFIGLLGSYKDLEYNFDTYYSEYYNPDITVFSEPLSKALIDSLDLSVDGVKQVDKSLVYKTSAEIADEYFEISATSISNNRLEQFYHYSSITDNGVYVEKSFADNNNISCGDIISIKLNDSFRDFKIIGIVSEPETVLYLSSTYVWGVNPDSGVVFIPEELIADDVTYYNHFSIYLNNKEDADATLDYLKTILGSNYISGYTYQNSPPVKEIEFNLIPMFALSVAVPAVFLGLMLLVYSLLLSRIIRNMRKEIGLLRAYGIKKSTITGLFFSLTLIITIFSIVVGVFAGYGFKQMIYTLYVGTLYMPALPTKFNIVVYIIPSISVLIVACLSVLINIRLILREKPINALNPDVSSYKPKQQKLNKSTKHPALKYFFTVMFRNKTRFVVSLVSIIVSMFLIFSAIVFEYSKDEIINEIYDDRIHYDCQAVFSNKPSEEFINGLFENGCIEYEETYIKEYKINDVSIVVQALLPNSKMINVFGENKTPLTYDSGITISTDTAAKLGVKIGDTLYLDEKAITISQYSDQPAYRVEYISIETMNSLELNMDYTLLMNTNDEIKLKNYILEEGITSSVSLTSKIHAENNKIFNILSLGVVILLALAFVTGFFVVFDSALANLIERRRELCVLRILGMQNYNISNGFLITSLFQFILAYAIGIPFASIFAKNILYSMTTDVRRYIYPNNIWIYIISAIIVLGMIIVSHIFDMLTLKKWNIAYYSKEKE